MKTYDIFIDFECISGLFARRLNKSFNQIPLSYTIGYRNKKNEIMTIFEIFNFQKNIPNNNNFVNYILDDFSKSIILNINKITKRRETISLDEINFIGWNPSLEEQLLSSIFKKKIPVNSLINISFEDGCSTYKREISLSKVTKNGYKNIQYFSNFRNEISKSLNPEEITKFNLNHDGAIVSYAGFVLFNIITKTRKSKYHIYMSAEKLEKEIEEYSLDDINRMYYFIDNLLEVKGIMRSLKIIDELKKELNKNTRLLELLKDFNPNLKIKDLIKKLETQNCDCKKKITLFEE